MASVLTPPHLAEGLGNFHNWRVAEIKLPGWMMMGGAGQHRAKKIESTPYGSATVRHF